MTQRAQRPSPGARDADNPSLAVSALASVPSSPSAASQPSIPRTRDVRIRVASTHGLSAASATRGSASSSSTPPGLPPSSLRGELTAASLAALSPSEQKQLIGERLYPLVHAIEPALAARALGMILEHDNGELLELLESPSRLKDAMSVAVAVLRPPTSAPVEPARPPTGVLHAASSSSRPARPPFDGLLPQSSLSTSAHPLTGAPYAPPPAASSSSPSSSRSTPHAPPSASPLVGGAPARVGGERDGGRASDDRRRTPGIVLPPPPSSRMPSFRSVFGDDIRAPHAADKPATPSTASSASVPPLACIDESAGLLDSASPSSTARVEQAGMMGRSQEDMTPEARAAFLSGAATGDPRDPSIPQVTPVRSLPAEAPHREQGAVEDVDTDSMAPASKRTGSTPGSLDWSKVIGAAYTPPPASADFCKPCKPTPLTPSEEKLFNRLVELVDPQQRSGDAASVWALIVAEHNHTEIADLLNSTPELKRRVSEICDTEGIGIHTPWSSGSTPRTPGSPGLSLSASPSPVTRGQGKGSGKGSAGGKGKGKGFGAIASGHTPIGKGKGKGSAGKGQGIGRGLGTRAPEHSEAASHTLASAASDAAPEMPSRREESPPRSLDFTPSPTSRGWADAVEEEEPVCSTCGQRSPQGVVLCGGDRLQCCNRLGSASTSCAIRALQNCEQPRIELGSDNPYGRFDIVCASSAERDVFQLGMVYVTQQTVAFLVRSAAEAGFPNSVFYPLVHRDSSGHAVCLAPWLLSTDQPHAAANASIAARNTRRANRTLPPTVQPAYSNAAEYYRTYSKLVAINAAADSARDHVTSTTTVQVAWRSGVQDEPVAWFDNSLRLVIGDTVSLSSGTDGPAYRAYVLQTLNTVCGASLLCDDPKEQVATPEDGLYTLRKQLLTVSQDRVQTALAFFVHDAASVGAFLRQEILAPGTARVPFALQAIPAVVQPPTVRKALNEEQRLAVHNALACVLSLLKGPPGTGKTFTAALIVYNLRQQQQDCPVLACSASNTAASNLALACHAIGLRVIRYYPITKSSAVVSDLPGDVLISHYFTEGHELSRLIKLRDALARTRTSLPVAQDKELKRLQQDSYRKALQGVDVICCTCSSAGDGVLGAMTFPSVLVDEAAQCQEPEVLVPLVRGAQRAVLVGDDSQLRATVQSQVAQRAGLGVSMFERLHTAGALTVMLNEQYRMHPAISAFPNAQFYKGDLRDGPNTPLRTRRDVRFAWPDPELPTLFIHCTTHQGECPRPGCGSSPQNPREASVVSRVVACLLDGGARPEELYVITGYEAQRQCLVSVLPAGVPVGNIDAIQGREKPFVILSLVRSNKGANAGFLNDPRRANVALTRAQSGLIICGDAFTFASTSPWTELLERYSAAALVWRADVSLAPGLASLDDLKRHPVQLPQASAAVGLTEFSRLLDDPARTCVVPGTSPQGWPSHTTPPRLPSHAPTYFARKPPRVPRSRLSRCCKDAVLALAALVPSSSQPTLDELDLPVDVATACLQYSTTLESASLTANGDVPPHAELSLPPASSSTGATGSDNPPPRRRVLGTISLMQYWWRARVVGYLTGAQTVLYWRYARSNHPSAVDKFRQLVASCRFATQPNLCTHWPSSYEKPFAITRPSRSWAAKRDGLLLSPLLPMGSPRAVPVAMRLIKGDKGVMYQHYSHAARDGKSRVGRVRMRFRLVRNMRCGYGALACLHVVRDAKGAPILDQSGQRRRVSHMNQQRDYDEQAAIAELVGNWYRMYCTDLQLWTSRLGVTCGFYLPGGHAEGVRQAGFQCCAIDSSTAQGDGERWFSRSVPSMFPDSPLVTTHVGDANNAAVRDAAVEQHPHIDECIISFDTPPCQPYSAVRAFGGTRKAGGDASGSAALAPDGQELLSTCVHRRLEAYHRTGEVFAVETVLGATFEPPDSVACVVVSSHQHGIRTEDKHKIYYPADCPVWVDLALDTGARRLAARSCAGASRNVLPLHPHSSPVLPPCCIGQDVSMHGAGYQIYSRPAICNILGVHPEHVSSKKRLNNLIPPRLARHVVSILGAHATQRRLGVPAVSYDNARHDPRLAAWVLAALRKGGSLGDPALPLPFARCILLICPENMPDVVLLRTDPLLVHVELVTIALLPTSPLIETILSEFHARYGSQYSLTTDNLRFVCDFLGDRRTAVFAVTCVQCGDAARCVRASLLSSGSLAPGSVRGSLPRRAVFAPARASDFVASGDAPGGERDGPSTLRTTPPADATAEPAPADKRNAEFFELPEDEALLRDLATTAKQDTGFLVGVSLRDYVITLSLANTLDKHVYDSESDTPCRTLLEHTVLTQARFLPALSPHSSTIGAPNRRGPSPSIPVSERAIASTSRKLNDRQEVTVSTVSDAICEIRQSDSSASQEYAQPPPLPTPAFAATSAHLPENLRPPPPAAVHNVSLPVNERKSYLEACTRLNIQPCKERALANPGGGRLPRPVESEQIAAVLHVLPSQFVSFSASTETQLIFSSRIGGASGNATHHLVELLSPWFRGYACWSQILHAITRAVNKRKEESAVTDEWVVASRSCDAAHISHSVPSRKIRRTVWHLVLPQAVEWTLAEEFHLLSGGTASGTARPTPPITDVPAPFDATLLRFYLWSTDLTPYSASVAPRDLRAVAALTDPSRVVYNEDCTLFLHTSEAALAIRGSNVAFCAWASAPRDVSQGDTRHERAWYSAHISSVLQPVELDDEAKRLKTLEHAFHSQDCAHFVCLADHRARFVDGENDFRNRLYFEAHFEATLYRLLLSLDKTVDCRAYRGVYAVVEPGWLMLAKQGGTTLGAWFEVTNCTVHSCAAECRAEHGAQLFPSLAIRQLPDAALEHFVYVLNYGQGRGNPPTPQNWARRLRSGNAFVCFELRPVPIDALLPTRDRFVSHQHDESCRRQTTREMASAFFRNVGMLLTARHHCRLARELCVRYRECSPQDQFGLLEGLHYSYSESSVSHASSEEGELSSSLEASEDEGECFGTFGEPEPSEASSANHSGDDDDSESDSSGASLPSRVAKAKDELAASSTSSHLGNKPDRSSEFERVEVEDLGTDGVETSSKPLADAVSIATESRLPGSNDSSDLLVAASTPLPADSADEVLESEPLPPVPPHRESEPCATVLADIAAARMLGDGLPQRDIKRVVRRDGIATSTSHADSYKPDAICIVTDCVAHRMGEEEAAVCRLLPHAVKARTRRAGSAFLPVEERAVLGTAVRSIKPKGLSCPDVLRLYAQWSPGAALSSRQRARQDAYQPPPVPSEGRQDDESSRLEWLASCLGQLDSYLRVRSALGSPVKVMAFSQESFDTPHRFEILQFFANRHAELEVVVVCTAERAVEGTREQARADIKRSGKQTRRLLRKRGCSALTRQLGLALSRQLENNLLHELDSDKETAPDERSTVDTFLAELRNCDIRGSTAHMQQIAGCKYRQRREHELGNEQYRDRVRSALAAGTISQDDVDSIVAQQEAMHQSPWMTKATEHGADKARSVISCPAEQVKHAAATVAATGSVDKSDKSATDEDNDDASPTRPSTPTSVLAQFAVSTDALSCATLDTQQINVSSKTGRFTPLYLRDVHLVSEDKTRSARTLRRFPIARVMLDTGSGTTLLGSQLCDELIASAPDAISSVEPLPSSVRHIRGIGKLNHVVKWVALSLEIGGCVVNFTDIPVLREHSGLLLGNDFSFCANVNIIQSTRESDVDGYVVLRDPDGVELSAQVAYENRLDSDVTSHSADAMLLGACEGGSASDDLLDAASTPLPDDASDVIDVINPIAFAPKSQQVPGWSEALIKVKAPACVTKGSTIALLPIDDSTYGDLGLLVAPSVTKVDDEGFAYTRVINLKKKPQGVPLLAPVARFIIDPEIIESSYEYDTDEIMKMIHVGPEDASGRAKCRALVETTRALFRSTLGYAHPMQASIPTRAVDEGRLPAPNEQNRPRPPAEEAALQQMVEKLHKQRIVEHADRSPYNARPLVLKKPDGTLRPAIDYRALNLATEKDTYPLPNIESNLASLGRADFFTTLDLLQGFLQIELDRASRPKTAFTIGNTQWQYTRMPMGLTSSPGSFMRIVDAALRGLPPGIAFAYV